MSEVKMSISEYDQIKENARLLEDKNKELKDAQDQINKLKDEKIEAMKQNENLVTIVETKRVFQSVYHPRPDHEVRQRLEAMGIYVPLENLNTFKPESVAEKFLGALYEFKEHESESVAGGETVYSRPLLEMRSDLKKTLKSELDKDVREKLEAAEANANKVVDLQIELKKVEQDAKDSDKEWEKLYKAQVKEKEKAQKELEETQTEITDIKERLDVLSGKGDKFESLVSFIYLAQELGTDVPLLDRKRRLNLIVKEATKLIDNNDYLEETKEKEEEE